MPNQLQLKPLAKIFPIRKNNPDDMLITCGSFEERFLGVPQIWKAPLPKHIVLFKFTEPNDKRQYLIEKLEQTLKTDSLGKRYKQIHVEHGKSFESVLELHKIVSTIKLTSKPATLSIDISTFTKDLLLNLMLYLINVSEIEQLRLFYTKPERYASPQEGWLSFGVKSIHIPPMCWNAWSPLKDNLVVIILGFEEMRAWSLIDKFSADLNWLFVTNPGADSQWDSYCEEYNKRLLGEIPSKSNVPALDPSGVSQVLSEHITEEICDRFNVFISPLGTKPQLIGTLDFLINHATIPVNMLTTTAVTHNIPYYSWGVGNTFEFYFPTGGTLKANGNN